MVDQLAREYARQPVVFIEHAVEATYRNRSGRWFAAYGANRSAQTPLAMVDSGFRYTNGEEDYHRSYAGMIDAALTRSADAEVEAFYEQRRVDGLDKIHLVVRVTNHGSHALSYDNYAAVHGILYEDVHVRDTSRFARSSAMVDLDPDLAPGESDSYELDLELPRGVQMGRSHVLAVVDYRPEGDSGHYDMVQAAFAVAGLPTPTAVATPTEEPTPTRIPTATATAAPTALPTAAPPTATAEPERPRIFLPVARRESPP